LLLLLLLAWFAKAAVYHASTLMLRTICPFQPGRTPQRLRANSVFLGKDTAINWRKCESVESNAGRAKGALGAPAPNPNPSPNPNPGPNPNTIQ